MFYAASKILWFFATPSNGLPILALAGLLLMLWGPARSFGYGLALAGIVLLLVAGLSPLASWVIRPLDDRFPTFQDDGGPVAGIIVLGGAAQAAETFSHHQLTVNEAGERLLALADLARRYPSARLIFSGGGANLLTEDQPESEAVLAFSDTLGIPKERLEIETESRTTSENAEFTRRLVEPKPGERWLLVTSSWHMPRAVGCFRKVGLAVTAYPVDFRTSWPEDATRGFPFVAEGLKRLDIATKEWVGLTAYRLAGHIDSFLPGP
jgi:uncharacterized SAM-binding protein YcdF (DUF218 family)